MLDKLDFFCSQFLIFVAKKKYYLKNYLTVQLFKETELSQVFYTPN